jgi:hypothetical protein
MFCQLLLAEESCHWMAVPGVWFVNASVTEFPVQTVWEPLTLPPSGGAVRVILIVSKEAGQLPLVTFHCKRVTPIPRLLTVAEGDEGSLTVPPPERTVQVPEPVEGVFAESTEAEGQRTWSGPAFAASGLAYTVSEIVPDATVAGEAQARFEVRLHETTSPCCGFVSTKAVLFVPAGEPFTLHCSTGLLPPSVWEAVKVTGVLSQRMVLSAEIETEGAGLGITVMAISSVSVHEPFSPVTVYVVDTEGVAPAKSPEPEAKLAAGDHV